MSTRGVSTPGAKKKVLSSEPIISRVSTRGCPFRRGGECIVLIRKSIYDLVPKKFTENVFQKYRLSLKALSLKGSHYCNWISIPKYFIYCTIITLSCLNFRSFGIFAPGWPWIEVLDFTHNKNSSCHIGNLTPKDPIKFC